MLLIRSLLFQVWFFGSACFFGALTFLFFWLPYRVRWSFPRGWGHSMMWGGRVFCGFRYQIEGQENIPAEPSVVMIKHTTVFETYAQLLLFPPQTWVLKRELLWIPLFGWGLISIKPIAINRSSGRAAVTQVIEQGKQRLKDGIWVSVFPEGTRVRPGTTKKYGVSGAALAREAGVMIVPVAHNAGDLWPRRGITKKPGVIRVVIGPPIDASTQSPKETNRLVQQWIEGEMAKLSPEAYAGNRSRARE